MSQFNNIAISGGGILAISFIGCIKCIQENKIDNFHNYLGSSAGSYACLLMILDYTIEEMNDIVLYKGLSNETLNVFSMSKLMNIFKNYGIANGDTLVQFVECILEKKNYDKNITFTELCKITGKNLIITTANINKQKIEYLCIDTYPDMKISTAIRMSVAVPILFEPIKYYDDYYVDALIYDNFSIDYFKNFKHDTLGLKINSISPKNTKKSIKTFSDYLFTMLNSIFTYGTNDDIIDIIYPNIHTIPLHDDTTNFNLYKLKFEINKEKYEQLFDLGYTSFETYYKNLMK